MEPDCEERIVMTPKKKTRNSTTLMMERKNVTTSCIASVADNVHVAGGSNAGIIVNKQKIGEDEGDELSCLPAQLCLEFRVFLINSSTKRVTQEKRVISFWFKDSFPEIDRAQEAQELFKKLVSPVNFPRDYVGFIKKIMKLMQLDYPMMAKIEVELTQEKEMEHLPNRPSDTDQAADEDGGGGGGGGSGAVHADHILAAIEQSYPNSLTLDDMSRRFNKEIAFIRPLVLELANKKLIKPVGAAMQEVQDADPASVAFRRVHHLNEDHVTVVKQMPRGLGLAQHPTIAVITAQYFEKVAVDAVMSDKQTFVRYATVGEANVYTLGNVGGHRVVTTKLPMTGTSRDAVIATGNTTTRLLGTFQSVEYVFIVGVGGAVPHYTDFDKHVRLGDVVLSCPPVDGQNFIYEYCENVTEQANGEIKFETRSWCPLDLGLQHIARQLQTQFSDVEWRSEALSVPWLCHYRQALDELKSEEGEQAWLRPSADTDKLYMSVGGGDVIEVGHPSPPKLTEDPRCAGIPIIHCGPIAAGRRVSEDDQLRQEFAGRHGIRAFDAELDSVVESIYGNRKDQYMLIKGMSDYKDGTRRTEWQPYAALIAASVMRTIIEAMPAP